MSSSARIWNGLKLRKQNKAYNTPRPDSKLSCSCSSSTKACRCTSCGIHCIGLIFFCRLKSNCFLLMLPCLEYCSWWSWKKLKSNIMMLTQDFPKFRRLVYDSKEKMLLTFFKLFIQCRLCLCQRNQELRYLSWSIRHQKAGDLQQWGLSKRLCQILCNAWRSWIFCVQLMWMQLIHLLLMY